LPCPHPPAVPSVPVPADGSTEVEVSLTEVDWADSGRATGYDVYLGTCPVPAYPDAAFTRETSSGSSGLSLIEKTEYCWQVVAISDGDCAPTAGPVWSFETGCAAEGVDPPVVVSPTAVTFPSSEASGSYRLRFDEAVNNVEASLTWSADTGTGTLGTTTQLAADLYDVAFSGVADGDAYKLTVATTVVDRCDVALGEPVEITLDIGCWPDEASCEDGDLCTVGDECAAGACVGQPLDCSDLIICTAEACDPSTGQCEVTDISPIGEPAPAFSLEDANQHSPTAGLLVDPITDADGKVRVLALHSCG